MRVPHDWKADIDAPARAITMAYRRIGDCTLEFMRIEYDDYQQRTATERLATGLGWFSIALGAAELLAPREVARVIGVSPDHRTITTLRAYGAREIASGIAILSQPGEAKWLWSRAGGDAIDLASLTAAVGRQNTDASRLALATAAVAGVAILDVLAAIGLTASRHGGADAGVRLTDEQAITIKAPLEAVENGWVAWCASGQAKLKNNYAIRFEPAPGARGTEVHLTGGGSSGTLREELRKFKQRLETGEVPVSDSPGLSRPARPRASTDPKPLAEVE